MLAAYERCNLAPTSHAKPQEIIFMFLTPEVKTHIIKCHTVIYYKVWSGGFGLFSVVKQYVWTSLQHFFFHLLKLFLIVTIMEVFSWFTPQTAAFLRTFSFLMANNCTLQSFCIGALCQNGVVLCSTVLKQHCRIVSPLIIYFFWTILHFPYSNVNAPKCKSKVWSEIILQWAIYILTFATAIFSNC